ncbi:MAG TPA: hypothetical protein V6C78_29010 [Crinalium sp.]|jgi:hypothetical protein
MQIWKILIVFTDTGWKIQEPGINVDVLVILVAKQELGNENKTLCSYNIIGLLE